MLQVPGKVDTLSEMQFVYSAATDHWTAYDKMGPYWAKAEKRLNSGGMVVKVDTPARDGDKFNVTRVRGEAERIEFLLNDGKEIAAASNFYPSEYEHRICGFDQQNVVEENPPDLESILDVTTNSISPVSFTEFRSGGVVGYIPANTESVDLASFGQSATLEFNFLPTEGLGSFSVVFGGNQYDFPSDDTRSTLFPLAEDGQTI